MGWIHDLDVKGLHEGHLCAYESHSLVTTRELGYPADKSTFPVSVISAGCDCGWRSYRWSVPDGAEWSPFICTASEKDEEIARALWSNHVMERCRQFATDLHVLEQLAGEGRLSQEFLSFVRNAVGR